MSTPTPSDVTALLLAWGRGENEARERLIPLVYAELRRLAAGAMAAERRDHTLDELSRIDEAQGRIVELRFFGGLSVPETAEVLGISPATVKRDWAVAR